MNNLVSRGVDAVLAVTRTVAVTLLMASVTLNFVNIIGRYFFSVSIPWAEEIMLFLMCGCVFLGSVNVAHSGRQIRMDVIVGMMPPKIRDALHVLSELAFIATAIAIAYFAWPVISMLAAYDERSEAANFPLVIPQSMVPLGLLLMALLVGIRLILQLRSHRNVEKS